MSEVVCAVAVLAIALGILPSAPQRRLYRNRRPARPRVRPAGYAAAVGLLIVTVCVAGVFTAGAGLIMAGTVAMRRRRRNARRRRRIAARALESSLDVVVAELRVGAHPAHAFRVAADEVPGPVGESLRAVAARAGLGADVAGGLRSAGRGAEEGHWERLAVCWDLAADHGLAVSTLMRAAALDLAERQRFTDRVDAGMAGARATATILAALPLLGVALGELIGAAPVAFLLSPAGGWFLIIGAALAAAGLVWAGHITDRAVA